MPAWYIRKWFPASVGHGDAAQCGDVLDHFGSPFNSKINRGVLRTNGLVGYHGAANGRNVLNHFGSPFILNCRRTLKVRVDEMN